MISTFLLLWQNPPTPPQGGANGWTTILFLLAAIAVIYFMMILPQSKQRKKGQNFLASLKKGKRVVTVGGIHGTIADITETNIVLIIAPKTTITVQKDAISMDSTNAVFPDGSENSSTTATTTATEK